jgi:anti-anti-sigma factor
MDVRTSEHNGVAIAVIRGSIDVVNSEQLQATLLELVRNGKRRLLLDLAQVDYVSSAGLRVFLAVAKELKAEGGHLRFCSLAKPVKQVFDLTGVSFRVNLYDTREAALMDFSA